MTTRVCVKEGQYIEIFIPDSYEGADIMQSDKYPEFRKMLIEMIGVEK